MSAAGWAKLAQHLIRARKLGRFRTRRDFAEYLGVSARTLDSLERARQANYSPDIVTAVEIGLSWAPGSFERVAAGGRPRIDYDTDLKRVAQIWPRLSAEARRLVVRLVEYAADS